MVLVLLRQLFGGFLPEGPGFELTVVFVVFVVDRVALEHVLLRSIVLPAYHCTGNLYVSSDLAE